jgi:DNA-binding CsgD family transcriptional regulator
MILSPRDLSFFLRDQFADSAVHTGRTILVNGGPGSGKTTALTMFAQHAEESGTLVLTAGGAPDEQTLRAGVVEQLINTPRFSKKTADRLRNLLPEGADDTIQRIHETCSIFLGLCREHPLVIVVDDVQYADDWSVRLLHHLHRRVRGARLLMVLARWSRPTPSTARLLAELGAAAHHQVQLGPMAPPEVTELARETPGADHGLVARLHMLSGGIPLLVHGLLDGDADALGTAICAMLQRWGAPLLDVSRALAILDEHADGELVALLVDAPIGVVEDMIDVLTRAGFVTGGRLRQPVVARGVLAGLTSDERVRLHWRAATVAYQAGRDIRIIAEQLVAAGQAGPGWPAASVRAAADQALATDDADFASRCLELALGTVDDERDRRDLRAWLARAAWRVNPERAARHAALLRENVGAGPPGSAGQPALIRDALWRGDQAALDEALGALRLTEPQTRAEILLARQWHFGSGDDPAGPGTSESVPWMSAARTLTEAWQTGNAEHAAASAELVLRGCPLADLSVDALALAITVLAAGNQADRAERWSQRLLAESAERGAVTWQAVIGAARSTLTLRRGDPAGAATQATAALDLLGAAGWGAAIGHPLATAVLGHTATGEHGKAAELLRTPVPAALFQTVGGLRYLHARGRHLLATNRALAAISDFDRCQRQAEELGVDLSWLVPWRRDLDAVTVQLAGSATPVAHACDPVGHADRAAVAVQPVFGGLASRQLGAPTRRLDAIGGEAELSEAERRVAELAALGRSNRQISGELFITISTVEQHLTRVYKKLGVIGRGDLAGKLGLVA